MFMHMPKKLGIPVLLAVGLCVGAYCVYVAMPVRVGDWEIYQGTGRLVPSPDREPYVDISYTVRQPEKPLFRFSGALRYPPPAPGAPLLVSMVLSYRSEWPTMLRIVVWDPGGTAWEAPAPIEHSDEWKTVTLDAAAFTRSGGAEVPQGARREFFWGLRPRVDFYDGSGVTRPSSRFSNRLCLRPIYFTYARSERP